MIRVRKPLLLVLLLCATVLRAASTITGIAFHSDTVTINYLQDARYYYLLQSSNDLSSWANADMSLGDPVELQLAPGTLSEFYQALPLDIHAPLDTDGDGIDDLYELHHPEALDPLDPTDAAEFAPGSNAQTNYQAYLAINGITSYKLLQRFSREVSVFNGGAPTAAYEATSREWSVFNLGVASAGLEAISREISIYNGNAVPVSDLPEIVSREWTVFNQSPAPSAIEAVSREVSIYNGNAPPVNDMSIAVSREWSVFNFGAEPTSVVTLSREVSVLNFTEP